MDETLDYIEYPFEIRVAPPAQFLKEAAYRNDEMIEGLTAAAQMFYQSARILYRTEPDQEQGEREMLELVRTYEYHKHAEADRFQAAQFWKHIEPSAEQYAKSKGTPEGDCFYGDVYGLGKNWRQKT